MNKPRILILLACFNGSRWIEEQITSILQQVDVKIDLIISDDCSTDDTVNKLIDLKTRGFDFQLMKRQSSSGSAGANFIGLFRDVVLQKGIDYVALADQDDIWKPRKLIEAIAALKKNSGGGYSCAAEAFWSTGKSKVIRQSDKVTALDFLYEGAGQGCTFVMPVSSFKLVKNFCAEHQPLLAEFHYHDWLIYLLIRVSGAKWVFDNRPWILYRQHGGNEIGARGAKGFLTRRLKLVRNGWYARQIKLAHEIAFIAEGMQKSALRCVSTADSSKIRRAVTLLKMGRRRLSDRIALFTFTVLGWI